MEKVIKIFMDRDGLSRDEAVDQLNEIRWLIERALHSGSNDEVEDILMDYDLEMDYINDILGEVQCVY